MSVVAHVTNDIQSVVHKLALSIPSAENQKLTKWKLAEASAINRKQIVVPIATSIAKQKSKIRNKQKKNLPKKRKSRQSTSTIVISPNKTQTVTNQTDSHHSESESESDCEIIENITPIIVIDDDVTNEPSNLSTPTITNETSDSADATTDPFGDTSIQSNDTTQDTTIETSTPIEPIDQPLFFVDKNPGTEFTAPIYEINTNPSKNTIEDMALNVRNIRITVPNAANLEASFAPNPLLSSTHVNALGDEETEENVTSSTSDPTEVQPTNFCISINSTCENGASRRVSMGRSSPVVPVAKVTNGHCTNNNNQTEDKNTDNDSKSSRPIKRKAETENHRIEPPSKRRYSESSDVIVVNDTVPHVDDDSVIFVSETIEHQRRNRINNTLGGKALDFISLPSNDNQNQNKKSPKSSRAKKRREKRKRDQVIQSKTISKQKNGKISRFSDRNQIISLDKFSSFKGDSSVTSFAQPSTSAKADKKKITLDYEKEKKLFAEKPELFEKRMIVIDGSNVAFTHGLRVSYSINGIEICIKYFEDRGFKVKTVVPQMRLKRNYSSDPEKLERLNNAGKIVITPCKNLPGQRSSSYDDRYILEIAEKFDAAIISNDNYSDLIKERPEWDEIIRERVVGFSWCDDFIMIPQDPYGKNGRSLQLILHKLKADANVEEEKPTT